MRRPALLAALGFALFAGCHGGEGAAAPEGAALAAFVYEGSPVVLVASPADAPPGDLAVAGAEVRVRNLHGTTLASATTAGDGSFRIGGLPGGYLKVEVRTDPSSALPDAVAEATGVPGAEVAIGLAHAFGRDAAIAAVLAAVPAGTRVLASLQPFPAGTRIEPAGGDPGSASQVPTTGRTLPAAEWFFFVDLFPGAAYAHPMEYAFVDAASGALVRETNVQWPPLANGSGFWGIEWSFVGVPGVDVLSVDPATLPADSDYFLSPEVVREVPIGTTQSVAAPHAEAPARGEEPAGPGLHNVDPASIFVILWRAGYEDYRIPNMLAMSEFFRNAGVPVGNVALCISPTDGKVPIEETSYRRTLASFNREMQERMEAGLHSTLVVYINSHGGGSSFGRYHAKDDRAYVSTSPAELDLRSTPACRVRVILEFCFARQFGEDLAKHLDGMPAQDRPDYAIYCACDKLEFSYSVPYEISWATLGFLKVGGRFTNALLGSASVANGDVAGLLNASGNGIADGLASLLGTLDFVSNNAVQHTSAIVRRAWPARCIVPGTLGVVLDRNLTSALVAGTFVPLAEIQGGHVAGPDACDAQHLHSTTGITIAGVGGPFPDPAPTTCGYGRVVAR